MRYYIQDWAGNDKTDFYGEFNTAEDAYEALQLQMEKLLHPADQLVDLCVLMDEFVILERGTE